MLYKEFSKTLIEKVKCMDKKKLIGISALIIIIILFLCFGTDSNVSKKEIINRIMEFESFETMKYPMKITEYTEYKRDTDREQKYDKIWVSIIAENDYAEYRASYLLNFGLYNSGWIFDNIERIDNYEEYGNEILYTKRNVEEDKIREDLLKEYSEKFDKYQFSNINITTEIPKADKYKTTIEVPCKVNAENDLMTWNTTIDTTYRLDKNKGWVLSNSDMNEEKYLAKNEPKEFVANAIKEQAKGEYSMINMEKNSDNQYTYYYTDVLSNKYKYLTIIYDMKLICSFNPDDNGWYIEKCDSEINDIQLDINGRWTYEDDNNKFVINIKEATSGDIKYDVEYFKIKDGDIQRKIISNVYDKSSELEMSHNRDDIYFFSTIKGPMYNEGEYLFEFSHQIKLLSYSGEQYDDSSIYIDNYKLTRQE